MKERLDVLLVKQGLAPSREKAKAMIMAGSVFVNDEREDKAGTTFDEEKARIEIKGHTLKYVSRGGLKLEKAMDVFGVDVAGKVCMDIGASTGGFTDCMLQNGAVKVFAVDVGYGQLAWTLRQDPRGGLHGKDKYPLCDTGKYRRAAGLCIGGCIVYFFNQGAAAGQKIA